MSDDPLYIRNEMKGFDRKDRDYRDRLTDEQKKKFSTYLMLKWGANVTGSKELQQYYLAATNERVNKNFFDLSKHPKLQWLLCTTVSPDMGDQYHFWIKGKKKDSKTDNKSIKFLKELYPHLKEDDIQLMAELNTKKDLKALARENGYTDEQIKTKL